MTEALLVTVLPTIFLIIIFRGEAMLRRQNIDIGGEHPIPGPAYALSKYSMVLLWAAAVVHAWGVNLSMAAVPSTVKWVALCLWILGFGLLLAGRLGLGESFRIGSAKESTRLKTGGLFSISRNPMYLGVYSTLFAAMLYTANPIVVLLGVYIIAVHHKIVLAEEDHLHNAFGQEYADYCRCVRRYL